MIIDRSKMIPDAVHFQAGKEPVVFFDLDATVIGTVFTNAEPKPCMRFYKKSVTDNRYSVLRPGIPELLAVIRAMYSNKPELFEKKGDNEHDA